MNIIKVSTTNRDEVLFQQNPAGDVEVVHVERTGKSVPGFAGPTGTPRDYKIATIKREELATLKAYFAAL